MLALEQRIGEPTNMHDVWTLDVQHRVYKEENNHESRQSCEAVSLNYVYLMTGELAPVVQRHEEPVPDQVRVHAPHTLLQGLVQL